LGSTLLFFRAAATSPSGGYISLTTYNAFALLRAAAIYNAFYWRQTGAALITYNAVAFYNVIV